MAVLQEHLCRPEDQMEWACRSCSWISQCFALVCNIKHSRATGEQEELFFGGCMHKPVVNGCLVYRFFVKMCKRQCIPFVKVWFGDTNVMEHLSAAEVAGHVLDEFDMGVYTPPEIRRLQEVCGSVQ